MKNIVLILALFVFVGCNKSHQKLSDEEYNALSEEQKRSVEYALEGIDLLDDELEITLFASEPMMSNPTNMDIDDKGRVWICEAYNYRNKLNPRNPYKKEGDRILILSDTNGDGKANESKVFYQGEDINAALGIAVLGNKVIVSCSPNVFVFTDEDGDDVADKKEVLFSGIQGEQHDHGMHSFSFAADGKLYFNYGNAGKGILDKNGNPLIDELGRPITSEGKPYREGMVFRCDVDGSNPEILAWNFRNNYEVAVDSYGRMWQSDNDDDGNRGTRINFVMDHGNYGFKDEFTGADWRTRRVNLEDSVYQQHWHLNDPGVVPNLLQTYAGSPTGITIYEGNLLPEKYRNQILHTDAGPNVLRAYPVQEDKAGFKADLIKILDGNSRDTWFRPSDVTVAPDGSIFVADWYDPGVGGHGMGDLDKGRIYRIAPKKHTYKVDKPSYEKIENCIELLQNPNSATRFMAYQALVKQGEKSIPALEKLYNGVDTRMRARAFYLLSNLSGQASKYIKIASTDKDENIRIAALKAARIHNLLSVDFLMPFAKDPSPQIRREVALAMYHKDFNEVWQVLSNSYKGEDRWYLEALGIAADGQWESYLSTYLEQKGAKWASDESAKDIVWRSRSAQTPELLISLISNANAKDQLRYYRALDFQDKASKNKVLQNHLSSSKGLTEEVLILRQLDLSKKEMSPNFLTKVKTVLSKVKEPSDFLEIVKKYDIKDQKEALLGIIYKNEITTNTEQAVNLFYSFYGLKEVKTQMSSSMPNHMKAIERFGFIDNQEITNLLVSTFSNTALSLNEKETAMKAMNGWNSEEYLWKLVQENKIPQDVMDIAKGLLLGTWHSDIRAAASDFFNESSGANYDVKKLMAMKGDKAKGKVVFETYCVSCHMVNNKGVNFGPGLSQIGAKLSVQGLYNSIINPSEGMGFGYETQLIKLKNGEEIRCIITSKTENEVITKQVGQSDLTMIKRSEVVSITQLSESLMPKFPLKETELVDLVAYLQTLK